ncbi:MAG: response regulator [Acidobacteria bacterium]|nr:response regulator [Acidobacteriota bacterium]
MLTDSLVARMSKEGDGFTVMSPSSKSHPTIMVVEDDDDSRMMMKILLETKGYRVLEAESGEAAIAAAEAEQPGLILMDLQLPRLSGFAVTRYVRQHDRLRETPIIIISGHDPLQHRQLALAAGCNEFLHKPIDFGLLEKTLGRLLPLERDS